MFIGGNPTKGDCYQCKQANASCYNYAEHIYNAGYRNCKDKVVLSKEEQDKILQATKKRIEQLKKERNDYKQRYESLDKKFNQLVVSSCEALAKKGKETAREILSLIIPNCKNCDKNWHKGCLCLRAKIAEKIAKQYGVEIKE